MAGRGAHGEGVVLEIGDGTGWGDKAAWEDVEC